MDEYEYCKHDLPPTACSTCLHGAPRPVQRTEPVPGFRHRRAEYDSRCPECDERIHVGELIYPGSEGRWQCHACTQADADYYLMSFQGTHREKT